MAALGGACADLAARLFPNLRPFWQQFWLGMLLGTVFSALALGAFAVWGIWGQP